MRISLKRTASLLLSAVIGVSVIFSGCSDTGAEEGSTYSKHESSSVSSSSQSSREDSSKTESSKSESSKSESSQDNISVDPDYTPAMWRVTKGDKEMYLFGSIHATDDSAKNLPPYVQNAFDECNYLALEIDMADVTEDFAKAYSLIQKMIYTDGTTIKDHISEETYNAAVKYLTDKGMYMSYYDSFKVLMWISLLENSIAQDAGIDTNNSMEAIMTEKANKVGKKILEVESVDIQLAVFDKISDKLADFMIKSYTVDGAAEEMKRSLTELYNSWKKGEAVSDSDDTEGLPDDLKDDYELYNEALTTNRNVGMADKAEEYMKDGKKVFFMVGAAHMYGESGIVSLLEKRGYTVERVQPESPASQAQSRAAA